VLGALDAGRNVDRAALERLLAAARPLAVTFHRAFDEVPDPLAALEILAELGVDRVLTSGQAATAEAGIPRLKLLVTRAAGRIAILAGGGIRAHNAARIVEQTGVRELHLRAGPRAEWLLGVARALAER
jgi:copper homeostasis protein